MPSREVLARVTASVPVARARAAMATRLLRSAPMSVDAVGIADPGRAVARHQVHALGIEAGEPPGQTGLRAGAGGVERQGVGVVGVHVLDRAALAGHDGVGAGEVEEQLLAGQGRGLGEAAVEVARPRIEGEEAEIREIGVELGLGMAGEEPLPRPRLGGLDRAADHREPWMGEGIALAALREQQRAARIGQQVPGVGREPRQQHQRRAVHVGGDRHQRREGGAVRIERRERPGADAAQQGSCQTDGVERRRLRGQRPGRAARSGIGLARLAHARPPPSRMAAANPRNVSAAAGRCARRPARVRSAVTAKL